MDESAQAARLRALDTCTVSDALDALGRPGALVGIAPTWECGTVAGRARTVRLIAVEDAADRPPVHLGARAIASAEPGDVIVVDNAAGRGISAGWGGLLALAARERGVAGVVVYGAARDVDDVAAVGLPMYADSVTTRTACGRTVELSTNEPLELEGVRVEPGDLVLADRSGVVVVRSAEADEVLAKAEELSMKEAQMAAALRAGAAVTEVLAGNYEAMLHATEQA